MRNRFQSAEVMHRMVADIVSERAVLLREIRGVIAEQVFVFDSFGGTAIHRMSLPTRIHLCSFLHV